ncbi:MAG: sigma-70 family RNA polymerase sigma factor [Myxococcota bacterium]
MRSVLSGSSAAAEALVSRHYGAVHRFCARTAGRDRADDLCQDVFVRVFHRLGSYAGRASFRAWLFTVARNVCIDAGRKGKFRKTESLDRTSGRDGTSPLDTLASTEAGPDVGVERARLRQALSRAVDALPVEQREVFLLREEAGLAFKEIARITGISENTAKSRMRYGLEALRRALVDAGWKDENDESR